MDFKKMKNQSNTLFNQFTHFKQPKPANVAKMIKNKLEEFEPYIPVIRALCNPGLKERHIKSIYDVAEIELQESTKLKTLQQMRVLRFKNELEEISENASKEFSNEKMLKQMQDQWEPMEFTTKDWTRSGTFILDGEAVEAIMQLLDDHSIKTQTMKGSPYAKFFIDEIVNLENDLLRTQDNLEVWLQVQSTWLYLEPVFSSDDIMKQMPIEGGQFREVDRTWRSVMARVKENSAARDIMKWEELGQILQEAKKKLESVMKGLNEYLESKRGQFHRFYFLSDEEMLEILSETKDPLRVQDHLKKCFEGIAELDFDEEKKIHGMRSSEKEYVKFVKTIDPMASKEKVEEWLLLVEEDMILSVKQVIEDALKAY